MHDGSRDQPCQEQTIDLMEAFRILETKEAHLKSLKEQITEAETDISFIKVMVQNLLPNQGQSIPSTAVANQSSPNTSMNMAHSHASIVDKAVQSSKRNKRERKEKTDVPTSEIAAKAKANKGKKKEKVHRVVATVATESGRKTTKAERKASRKARRKARRKAKRKARHKVASKQQQQAEKKLGHEAAKQSLLGFAPVRL